MALEKFTLATLAEMDSGRIRVAFEQALKRLEDDLKDRPAVESARKITLLVSLVPVVGDEGDLDSVDVDFKITDSVPKRESKTYNMQATRSGLLFNELSPDDVKQRTLDMVPRPKSTESEPAQGKEVVADAR
jgi:hypothetical protein